MKINVHGVKNQGKNKCRNGDFEEAIVFCCLGGEIKSSIFSFEKRGLENDGNVIYQNPWLGALSGEGIWTNPQRTVVDAIGVARGVIVRLWNLQEKGHV
ncbi:hypothetical protein TNCV_3743241 [Trichonephila clavipes]|nr:hypothetical protein TNCV_3743241 [Trichonephila clavipes]